MSDDTTTDADVPQSSADEQLAALDLSEEERLVLARVADIVRRINYGTVVLVIQDGKVVQVEMAEKFRLR
ncbi:MAG TPA: YezD family protein [Actinomycetota bacterium]|nr:YezD family protein [Actinomycetota bacterium]